MAFKIVLFCGLLAACNAGLISVGHHGHHGHEVHAAPILIASHHGDDGHHEDHHAPAHYEFKYSVHDPHTGDVKSQHETRKGDVVKGEYSLVEPDGHLRVVKYTADHHNGFQAHVHREGLTHEVHHDHHHHVAPVAIVSHHAPIAHHSAVHHIAPVEHHVSLGHGYGHGYGHDSHHIGHGHGHESHHGVATSHSSIVHHIGHEHHY